MNTYTVKDVAEKFSVSQETVRRWIRSGKLHARLDSRKNGATITEFDLQEFYRQVPKYSRRETELMCDKTDRKDLGILLGYLVHERNKLDMEIQRIKQLLDER
jgi:DeoR/GlpR family transcriptional regulator of sugar metabolism